MNEYGMHYIRTMSFPKRKAYADQVSSIGRRAVVVSSSVWFVTEYKCLMVHPVQTIRELLQHLHNLFDLPSSNVCVFDGVTKNNISHDLKIENLQPQNDETRYLHFVIL